MGRRDCNNLGMKVHASFRNKGIGTVLMGKTLSQMRSLGASVARLDVHADNIPALKLYDRYQFKVEKTYLYMLKELDEPMENQTRPSPQCAFSLRDVNEDHCV